LTRSGTNHSILHREKIIWQYTTTFSIEIYSLLNRFMGRQERNASFLRTDFVPLSCHASLLSSKSGWAVISCCKKTGLVPFRCSLFDVAGVIANEDNTRICFISAETCLFLLSHFQWDSQCLALNSCTETALFLRKFGLSI